MTERDDRIGRSSSKTTWQPSAQDLSSRSFRGSFTTRDVEPGTPTPRSSAPRRWIVGVVALTVVGLVAGWAWRQQATDSRLGASIEPVAVVELVRGPVRLSTVGGLGETPPSLAAGATLEAGVVVETGEPDGDRGVVREANREAGRVALRLGDDLSVRLDAGSRARIVSPTRVDLERGAVYVDSESETANAIEVRTTFGVVRDIGTQFEVRLLYGDDDGALGEVAAAATVLVVRVREGEVRMTTVAGTDHSALAGEQLTARDDGSVEPGTTPLAGESWDWVLTTAAVPDIEGRPLVVFLDWLMREGGWTLDYADATTAERVAEVSLHGTIDGLNAEEAMPMVLEGSGLGFTIDGERFVLRTTGEDIEDVAP